MSIKSWLHFHNASRMILEGYNIDSILKNRIKNISFFINNLSTAAKHFIEKYGLK